MDELHLEPYEELLRLSTTQSPFNQEESHKLLDAFLKQLIYVNCTTPPHTKGSLEHGKANMLKFT